ncbi:hypothetical protein Bca52824_081049 [Brassica carinata]|uniref:Uncharacterized protein n=1 Tax=Brassica carinata TaxID=52824 RepID=A0A8X7PHY5_BRACI|nr:hypothetical protein Bca52824_081049 [Brassica carinata]
MSSSFNFPRPTTKAYDLEDLYTAAREEGLSFGLSEFRQLVLVKRNQQNPGTFLVSPRSGCHVIEDIPYRDEKWHEQFFVFKMDRASMGDFDFSRLPRRWAENITPSGSSSMSDKIRGLIGILRRDRSNWSTFDQARIRAVFAMPEGTDNRAPLVGGSEDEAENSEEVIATPSVQTQSSDRLTRQLRWPPVSLSPGLEDEIVAATRKRRRSSEGALPGSSRPRFVPEGDGSLFCLRVAVTHLLLPQPRRNPTPRLRWRALRYVSCLIFLKNLLRGVRSLISTSSQVMEAFNDYVVVMEDHVVASQNDGEIESIGSKIKRLSKELEATKREGKKDAEKIEALTEDCRRIHLENEALMTQMVAQKARITALEDKWTSKNKEVSAEIQLQEVIANIDLLNELKDGGLSVDAELARLKEMEGDCEDLVASASVSDWSISELDLPQVSDDSPDQVGGSSVPDDSASS